ncbi:GLPGLI family protein [Olleya aquimaris]|uniref:GLPGLI family protein n=1 Tax=Olleya sediminilitoris TaxID=2795739 RepID=A0ABS1WHD8_9FLAO|nr:GLPGLI family protein [Olleya sediminilitoris]AXO80801.1 GLPGLI family protein [Olleya aquimaris]MBL7558530.1 GLPGLI family protein [Olleya sediminilitoris]
MKKIIFLLFVLSNSIFTIAQTSGIVTYSVQIDDIYKDKPDTKKQIVNFFNEVRRQANYIEFKLSYNEKYSKFDAVKSIPIEGFEMPYGIAKKIVADGIYFQNKASINSLRLKIIGDEKFFINEGKDKITWKILKDSTKKIGSFNCLKAVGTSKIINPNSKKENKIKIIAWFASAIPSSHGPLGYGFLPGLILELKQGPITFTMMSYKKSENVNIKYPKVNNDGIISLDEFNEKYISAFKNKF